MKIKYPFILVLRKLEQVKVGISNLPRDKNIFAILFSANYHAINTMTKNKAAQQLGKLSAKKRKANGHDSNYYRELVKKRWSKGLQEINTK